MGSNDQPCSGVLQSLDRRYDAVNSSHPQAVAVVQSAAHKGRVHGQAAASTGRK